MMTEKSLFVIGDNLFCPIWGWVGKQIVTYLNEPLIMKRVYIHKNALVLFQRKYTHVGISLFRHKRVQSGTFVKNNLMTEFDKEYSQSFVNCYVLS